MDSMDNDSTFENEVHQPPAVAMALQMPEILEIIFTFLVSDDQQDLINAALVSRNWRDAAYHPTLWRRMTVFIDLQKLDTVQLLPSLARRRIQRIELNDLQTDMRDFLPSLPSLKGFCYIRLNNAGPVGYPMTDEMLHGAFQQSHAALTSFSLYNCRRITDASVILLSSRLPNLEKLCLTKCIQVSDAGLVAVASHLVRLKNLDVGYCAVTDAGVATLAGRRPEVASGCPMMRRLNLSRCNITDTALQHISVGLPKMRYLVLIRCRELTDAGLLHLGNMGELSYLRLDRCRRITDEGPKPLSYLEKGRIAGEYRRPEKSGLLTYRSFFFRGATYTYKCKLRKAQNVAGD